MKVPSNTLGTVRSTMLIVALLACAFIVFDSYHWQLLSISWPKPSFAPSHSKTESSAALAMPPTSPAAATTEDTSTKVTTSGAGSDANYFGDEGGIANDEHSLKNGSIPGDLIDKETKEKYVPDDGRLAGYDHAATSSSQISDYSRAISFPQENNPGGGSKTSETGTGDNGQEFTTLHNLTAIGSGDASSSVDSRLKTDRLKAQFDESDSNVEAVPPFGHAPDSEERAVTGLGIPFGLRR